MTPWAVLIGVSLAGEPLPEPVVAAFARLAEPKTLAADFVQVQHRAVLSRPFQSTGHLVFERPERLRWEIEAPVASVFVMDGAEMGSAMPALGVSERLSLAGRPDLLGLVHGLTVWLHADAARVAEDYEVVVEATDPLAVALTPRDPAIRRWVERIRLVVAPEGTYVREVELIEPDGDRVGMTFTGVVLDAAPPPDAFDLP